MVRKTHIEDLVESLIHEIEAQTERYLRYIPDMSHDLEPTHDAEQDWLDQLRAARQCRRSTRIRPEDIS
jgi:hypothetical protein